MHNTLEQIVRSARGRAGIGLAGANYLQAAVGFGVAFFLANRLGPEQYGLLSYGLILGTIVYTVVNFAAERTLVRDLVQRPNPDAIMTASLIWRTGLAFAALAIVGSAASLGEGDNSRRMVILWCTIAALFWACGPVAWFDARYQMHRQAAITLAEKITYGLLVVSIFVTGVATSPAAAAFCLMLTRGASLAIQLRVMRHTWQPDTARLREHIAWLINGSAVILLAALANLLISHWNQLVLERLLPLEHLGYYALAFQMIAVVTLLQNQIVRLVFPRIAELTALGADPRLAERRLIRYALFGWGLSLVVVVPLLIAAPWVLDRFFTPAYASALAPLRILGAWAVFYGGARMINAFLVNLRLDRQYLWCSIGAGAAAVLLGLILIPRHGGIGVALALLISHPLTTVAQWHIIIGELKRRPRPPALRDEEAPRHAG